MWISMNRFRSVWRTFQINSERCGILRNCILTIYWQYIECSVFVDPVPHGPPAAGPRLGVAESGEVVGSTRHMVGLPTSQTAEACGCYGDMGWHGVPTWLLDHALHATFPYRTGCHTDPSCRIFASKRPKWRQGVVSSPNLRSRSPSWSNEWRTPWHGRKRSKLHGSCSITVEGSSHTYENVRSHMVTCFCYQSSH